ncbi:MAG TPA: hypothetical protein VHI77_06535 [Solirubrobacterales bacterium]|jgi:hypothetical protein|nr:hypothetical protein [Solirubrobacterales bacterium]
MSAGLGTVPPEQTYLDVTQGNRVFDSLYDPDLPKLKKGDCPAWRQAVTERAESAPAEIVPGLLTSTLEAAGVGVRARGGASCTFSPGWLSNGESRSSKKLSGTPRPHHLLPDLFEVRNATLATLSSLAANSDLLIAIARPTGQSDDPVAIGIAGHGFDGDLTSDSTRTDGYVLSTDLAPTILDRFGLEAPSQMSGQRIRTAGSIDPAGIESLGARMGAISSRRGPVIGLAIGAWLTTLILVALFGGGRGVRPAVRVLGLSVVYLPLVLLGGAGLEAGEGSEQLLVTLGAPLLAVATLAVLDGYRALAVASALTVLAYAIDVVAGSPLTRLSLLGPNPGLGVRFYGIGNELEALLAVLVVAGTGAGLAGFGPRLAPRRCAALFLALGLLCAFVFAAGGFGADVGAAIVFPVGVAVAAVTIAGGGRRGAWLVVAAPFVVLALLALIDLVSGANAHLTRSVLDAGGLGSLADVAQRRLQLSAHSFVRPVLAIFLPVVAVLAVLAIVHRDRLRAWLVGYPAMRAGLLGALAATAVGTLANDSGALLLVIGAAYLLAFTGFAWAEHGSVRNS